MIRGGGEGGVKIKGEARQVSVSFGLLAIDQVHGRLPHLACHALKSSQEASHEAADFCLGKEKNQPQQ